MISATHLVMSSASFLSMCLNHLNLCSQTHLNIIGIKLSPRLVISTSTSEVLNLFSQIPHFSGIVRLIPHQQNRKLFVHSNISYSLNMTITYCKYLTSNRSLLKSTLITSLSFFCTKSPTPKKHKLLIISHNMHIQNVSL